MNCWWDEASVQYCLDLHGLSSSDVGNGPGSLLLDVGLWVCEQGREVGQGTVVQHHLGLLVVPCHNVADGSQSRGLERKK